VIQRNLVYVTNLALSLAKEELLNSDEYFGRYGKIMKIVVNKNNLYNVNSPGGPSVSAYVTYFKEEDARDAIEALDGSWLGGRTLRASFGTTKYCTFFLKGVTCTNPDCLYLHELGGDDDSFTKEEMALGKSNFYDQIHPNSLRKEDEEEENMNNMNNTNTTTATNNINISNNNNNNDDDNGEGIDNANDGSDFSDEREREEEEEEEEEEEGEGEREGRVK